MFVQELSEVVDVVMNSPEAFGSVIMSFTLKPSEGTFLWDVPVFRVLDP